MTSPTTSASLPLAEADVLERLSELVRVQRGTLSAVARHEGLTPEAAVDCVQEALCTVLDLAQAGELGAHTELGPVLVTVVRNAARNQRRRHFRARPHDDALVPDLPDAELVLQEELVARAEETVRLRACVAELCEIQRAVVTLRLLEERPGENVAELLGVTTNHVAVLLYRAKAALRACMTA
jgi:RNA polymerase sigma-70 factor (ECF subfamily)